MAENDTTDPQDAPDAGAAGGTGPSEAQAQPGGGAGVGSQPGAIESADEVDPERFDAG